MGVMTVDFDRTASDYAAYRSGSPTSCSRG